MTERWVPVVGWESFYEVSSYGRVRSLTRLSLVRYGGVARGRLLAQHSSGKTEHRTVTLCRTGVRHKAKVHRLVLEAFVGSAPSGFAACHRDDNPLNNAVENLYWGSHTDNMRDRVRNGRHPNARKTHCKRNHALTSDNVYVYQTPSGGTTRKCRRCVKDRTNA